MRGMTAVLGVVAAAEAVALALVLTGSSGTTLPLGGNPTSAPGTGSAPASAEGAGRELSADNAALRLRNVELGAAVVAAQRERDEARVALEKAQKLLEENFARVREMKDELHRLRAEVEAYRKGAAPSADPLAGKPDEALTEDEMRHRNTLLTMRSQMHTWAVRQPIPVGAATELGLSESQRQAIEAALAEEADAMDREVRALVKRELGDGAPPDVDRLDAGQLCTSGPYLTLLQTDGQKVMALGGKQLLAFRRGTLRVADVVGADRPWTRLAAACAPLRERTWAAIARHVNAAQLEAIKANHVPAGWYRYPNNVHLVFGR